MLLVYIIFLSYFALVPISIIYWCTTVYLRSTFSINELILFNLSVRRIRKIGTFRTFFTDGNSCNNIHATVYMGKIGIQSKLHS